MKKVTTAPAKKSATIVVSLPADAKLTVDGTPTQSTSARRVFESPDLAPGKKYNYTFKATVMRDGKEQVVTKTAEVAAGKTSTVKLELPKSTTVASR